MRSTSILLKTLIITTALSWMGCGEKATVQLPPAKVNVVRAIQSDVPLYEDFVAQTYGQADVDIRARVEGWVMSMKFKEGARIKKGDLLYTIDDIQYQARVDQEESELAQAKTEMVRAQNELSRVKPLTEMNALSQKDLDNSQAAYDAAVAHVRASEASLENARIELGYTQVYSPFDGIAGISNVREGDYVSRLSSNSVMTTISSVGSVRVRFQISEREYLRISRATPEQLLAAKKNVQLILADGSLYENTGEVSFADREIDPKTGTLTIEASFPNPKGLLRPGMFVKARVLMGTVSGAILIPQRSVLQLQNISQVYILTDSSTLKAISVETGPKYKDGWIIRKGLNAGDRVAIVGSVSLTPNSKVEPVEGKWPEEPQPQ